MEETIELREIIEIVFRGKWIIALITAVAIGLAGIVSWFVLPEQYDSNSTIQIVTNPQDAGLLAGYVNAEFSTSIFSERIQSKRFLENILIENNYSPKDFNIENLIVNIEKETNLIDVSYQNGNPELAQKHLELFINETKKKMNSSVISSMKSLEKTYTSETEILSTEIEGLIEEYNTLIKKNSLPEVLIMQSLLNNQVLMTVSDEQINALVNVNGSLHNQLMQMQSQILSKATEYRNVLDRYQAVKSGINSFSPEPYIRVISEPSLAKSPISPNKILNIAIAAILGVMIGIGIVFFREYWKNTAPDK
ncbi:Wzz/FepE/Etk N-terminal domain-containing protein [Chungangia koreensis]|uniref:Capsular polysaccharide biosynthesis protein CpsC n=1 Tax=Chungangia koreensis TaxID=752657 RepID=A0ABV8X3C1_9LACT